MIFVTLGNAPHAFMRLAEKVDEIAGKMPEEFLVQCGHTGYDFRHAKAVKFLDHSKMRSCMAKATILVSHGGCGTIFEALKMGKKIVAVPRLAGEHNHSQYEFVEALAREGCLLAVYDIDQLESQVHAAKEFTPKSLPAGNAVLLINQFIVREFPGRG